MLSPPSTEGITTAPEVPIIKATVAACAKIRARIMCWLTFAFPDLNATKPAQSTAPVMPAPTNTNGLLMFLRGGRMSSGSEVGSDMHGWRRREGSDDRRR